MKANFFIALIIAGCLLDPIYALEEDCRDLFGNLVTHGNFYVPGPSPCTLCVCYHSKALWCKSIYCDPPYFCTNLRVGERCCEYQCLDSEEDIEKAKEKHRRTRKLFGLSFTISDSATLKPPTTTEFLSLLIAILLFKAMSIC